LAACEDTQIEEYPLSPRLIAEEQKKDTELQESIKNSPEAYMKVTIENTEVTAVKMTKWSYPSHYEDVLWHGPTTT
jgi:hypothetical protein